MQENIRIYGKPVQSLNDSEYEACYKNNFGPGGGMQRALIKCRSELPAARSRAVMAWNEKGQLLGWCLLMRLQDGRTAIHTFVHHKFRFQGVGRALLKRCLRGRKYPLVCYWSIHADGFYKKMIKEKRVVMGDWQQDKLLLTA